MWEKNYLTKIERIEPWEKEIGNVETRETATREHEVTVCQIWCGLRRWNRATERGEQSLKITSVRLWGFNEEMNEGYFKEEKIQVIHLLILNGKGASELASALFKWKYFLDGVQYPFFIRW